MSFLHVFNRLASGEEMPVRRPLRRLRRRLSTKALTLVFVSVWTLVTAGMLSFALIMTHVRPGSEAGGPVTCSAASATLLPCARDRAPGAP